MILDVFNIDLFTTVKELSILLDDSKYSISVKLNDSRWTFLVYYIQENKYNNIKSHENFIKDFESCISMM